MRRLFLLVLLSIAVVGLTACSDDGDGGGDDAASDEAATTDASADDPDEDAGDDAALCATVEGQTDLLEGEADTPTEDQLAAFDEMAEAAPEDVQPAFETVRDTFVQISELDEDIDSLGEAFDLVLDPEFIGAIEDVAVHLEEACGIDLETPSEAGLLDEDGEVALDDDFDTGALRDFLAEQDPAIEDRVQTIGSLAGVEVTVGVVDLDDPGEGVEICELISTYVYDEVGADGTTIKVQDTETNDVAVREDAEASCEAA